MKSPCKKIGEEEILAARILIVDDDRNNLEIAQEILTERGFTNIITESSPVLAFQHFVEESKVDLLLLDLMMPRFDGFDFLGELCQMTIDTPVLVLTVLGDEDSRRRAFALGSQDYVTKPFRGEELTARVRNLLIAHLAQKKLDAKNNILEMAVANRTAMLESTQREIIERLGYAGEFRDNETGMHVRRMSHYSQIIGRAAGMSEKESGILLLAAPMHDIGKIGIRDDILLKPGKLDAQELAIMKTHAEIGAKILGRSKTSLMMLAEQIALTHHEKWDGSGYPQGLVGEAIPLVGRIVAIADVFEALTSDRPYKKAWTVDESMQFLHEQSGKHFDPVLVDIFQAVLPQILEVRELFADNHQQNLFPTKSNRSIKK